MPSIWLFFERSALNSCLVMSVIAGFVWEMSTQVTVELLLEEWMTLCLLLFFHSRPSLLLPLLSYLLPVSLSSLPISFSYLFSYLPYPSYPPLSILHSHPVSSSTLATPSYPSIDSPSSPYSSLSHLPPPSNTPEPCPPGPGVRRTWMGETAAHEEVGARTGDGTAWWHCLTHLVT